MESQPDPQPFIHGQNELRQSPTRNNLETRSPLRIHDTCLQNKIKRVVRILLDASPDFCRQRQDIGIKGLSHVTDATNPFFIRLVWGFIFLVCVTICVSQIHNRLSYYLSKPVVVDVTIKEEQNVRFLSPTIASTDTTGTEHLYQEYNLTHNECSHPVKVVLENARGFDVNKIWTILNLSESVEFAAVVTRKHIHKVRWNEENGKYGLHLRFQLDKYFLYDGMESKFVLKVKKQLHSCKWAILTGSIQPKGMPGDRKNAFMFNTMTSSDLLIAMKQYVFLHRRSQICTDDAAYFRCWNQCTAEKFRKLPCRFPFIPEEVKIPTCISSRGMGQLYGQTAMEFTTLHCQCPRRCQETAIHMSMRFVQANKNETIVNMYLVSNRIVVITERFAYDIVSLFSDIGGTLGLCLGLSILSIFEVLQNLALITIKRLRYKKENVPHVSPVLSLVKRILSEELTQCHNLANNLDTTVPRGPVHSSILRVVFSSVIISCVVGSCLFMYVRVIRYWSEPTHMTVQIVHQDTVHFPDITICSLSTQIATRLRDLARKRDRFRRTPFNPLMEDWCTLQLTDLLDDPTMSAEKVWEDSSVFTEHENSMDVGKMLLNKSYIETVFMREVNLLNGRCTEVHIGEQLYAGSTTQYSRAFRANAFLHFKNELVECDRHYQEVFITPPDEIFHLNTRLLFPSGMRTLLSLESKEVTLWNTHSKPCAEHQLAKECYIRCLQKKIEENILCRLPYMPPTLRNIPACNSSRAGIQAQAAYLTQALNFDPLQHPDCGCRKSCKRTIITSSMYVAPHGLTNFTLFTTFFFNNIYEHIVDVPSDSLSSLLCDIGGNLGLTLGASLMYMCDMVQSIMVKMLAMIKKHTHLVNFKN